MENKTPMVLGEFPDNHCTASSRRSSQVENHLCGNTQEGLDCLDDGNENYYTKLVEVPLFFIGQHVKKNLKFDLDVRRHVLGRNRRGLGDHFFRS